MLTFSDRLKKALINKNITQKQLGLLTILSEPVVSQYVNGVHEPSLLTLVSIAHALNVTPNYLLGWDDQPEPEKESKEDSNMSENILLKSATRDELIRELSSRKSITGLRINEDEGANITTMHGNVYVLGESYIFVVRPVDLNKNTTATNSDV